MDYFLLRALAAEWDAPPPAGLRGARLADAWTQSPAALSLRFEAPQAAATLHVHCDPALPLLFRSPEARSGASGRARRNTAVVFAPAHGRTVATVGIAERDRFVSIGLDDETALLVRLFGPQPNVWWVDGEGRVREAFLGDVGEAAPQPHPAPVVETPEAFDSRWPSGRKTLGQAVAVAVPLFDRALADEAVRRAGLDPASDPGRVGEDEKRRLFDAVQAFSVALAQPRPVVYTHGERVETLALVPLTRPPDGWAPERFETTDEAVRVWARRRLAQRRFDAEYRPLERALDAAYRKLAARAGAMADALAAPSRASRYERWAHLLMAQATAVGPGRAVASLPDLLSGGAPVTIPLDPARSAVENAERYYRKARQARAARRHAESRWMEVQAESEATGALLGRLRAITRYADLQAFLKAEAGALTRLIRPEVLGETRLPYRRFEIAGWEVRVGKNARSNAELTTHHAGPHDLWLHARGVSGAHVVLRRPTRTAAPPKPVVEAAARLAAHFSEARTQALVPVQVAERKHVRTVRGGAPGQVRVAREEVLLVKPGLTADAQPAKAK